LSSPLAYLLFIGVGLLIGLLGAGGGILTLPILVSVVGLDTRRAVPMSLLIVGSASLVGALVNAWRRRFAPRPALAIVAPGVLGAAIGSALTSRVPPSFLLLAFSAVMGVTGALMWRHARRPGGDEEMRASRAAAASRRRALLHLLVAGFGVGLLTGFLGVGGGFVIVPVLVMAGGLEMHRATATSMGVIAINAAAGLLAHAHGDRLDLATGLPFLALTLAGMFLGLGLGRRVPARRLELAFATLVLSLAAVIGGTHLLRLLQGAGAAAPR
jgi:uncharacterized membrane protein YfcA